MRAPIQPSLSAPTQSVRAGDIAFARMEKVSSELVAITYGALVSQLLKGKQDAEAIHADLDRIGHNFEYARLFGCLLRNTEEQQLTIRLAPLAAAPPGRGAARGQSGAGSAGASPRRRPHRSGAQRDLAGRG